MSLRRQARSFVLSGFVLVASACASAAGSGAITAAGSGEVITAQELSTVSAGNAYQAIQRLRPQFLRDRNSTSLGTPNGSAVSDRGEAIAVYVDNSRMGSVDALQQIDIKEIQEIRRLSASEAMQRYGSRQMGTVIAVTLKH